MAKMLEGTSLIVWDEAAMANKSGMEALDRILRDLQNNNRPMEGVTIMFAGNITNSSLRN